MLSLFEVLFIEQNMHAKMVLICMLKWFAALLLGVLTHCDAVLLAELIYIICFQLTISIDLKWEYSPIKQDETGR